MRRARSVGAVMAVVAVTLPLVLPIARVPGPGTLFAGRFAEGLSMQVVAHPDDDLLFMSPDLEKLVAKGGRSVTVYLTAGESVAGLKDDRNPRRYAAARERGVRAAYAWVAGARDRWRRKMLRRGPIQVAEDTLVDRPWIKLVFARLPDGGDPRAKGGRGSLTRLWDDSTGQTCVHAFASGPECLTRENVLDMLRAMMRTFHPTVLRTLDPDPPPVGRDHVDHIAAARFAAEAAPHGIDVIAYRGYTIESLPPNLDPVEREVKRKAFAIYRQHDYRIGSGRRYDIWVKRMYLRWPDNLVAHKVARPEATPAGER
ncbi:PIG-L family deacetylase [Streptosporangium sp. NPDC000396]|uniref:PIG-L family deacetylase n=1 Tax=Streptosporangium sp. NPDC000396 TaxID=3366185 RepID=UPI00369C3F15